MGTNWETTGKNVAKLRKHWHQLGTYGKNAGKVWAKWDDWGKSEGNELVKFGRKIGKVVGKTVASATHRKISQEDRIKSGLNLEGWKGD